MGRSNCLLVAVGLALLLGFAPTGHAAKTKPAFREWIEGPIRYVARPAEMKLFRKLTRDADRALFVEEFWSRRDPSPDTLTNEYRQLFWERVKDANELFLDSSKPGWKTDRGKIYILYGAPTRIEEDLHVQTGGLASAGQGLIRWIYEGRPEQRKDLNPIVIVAFVRDTGGEYRVSYDPKLTSIFYDPKPLEDRYQRAMDHFLETYGAPVRSELSVMLDLGRMQEIPPQAQVFLERVETVESYQTHPLEANVSRYLSPDLRGAVVVVTVDVTHIAEPTRPAVIARFAHAKDPSRPPLMLGEDSFHVAATDGRRLAQGRIVLQPGRFDLTVLVVDPKTAVTGMHRSTLVTPPPSTDLRFSDVVWARELAPVPYASLASYDEPFHVGPFRVLPRLESTYHPGDTLKLFYEVYGGQPPYRVAYQVEGREDDGRWVALGRPSDSEQAGQAQGWDLSTTGEWPLGDYRVHVAITDREERQIETAWPFTLATPEPGDLAD